MLHSSHQKSFTLCREVTRLNEMLLRTLTKSTQWYKMKRDWWFTHFCIGALDFFSHSLLTHQSQTANRDAFSVTESILDAYLHYTGRTGFLPSLYFSHLLFAPLTQIIALNQHLLFLFCSKVFHSVIPWLCRMVLAEQLWISEDATTKHLTSQ